MSLALRQAQTAQNKSLPPIGAVIVRNNHVISKAYNQKDYLRDATAHAEIQAIRIAGKKIGPNLDHCYLYVTLMPCLMCICACYWAHIDNIYFGIDREGGLKYFETRSSWHEKVIRDLVFRRINIMGGIFKDECRKLYS